LEVQCPIFQVWRKICSARQTSAWLCYFLW
jgi:hypothetical protein